nr:hypothetical protein [Morganella morganii]
MTNGSGDSGSVPELSIINALYYPQSQQPEGDPCAHTEKQSPSQPLELMTCQKGNRIIATGRHEWFNGYQLTGAQDRRKPFPGYHGSV